MWHLARAILAIFSRFSEERGELVNVRFSTMIRWHRLGWRILWRLKRGAGLVAVAVFFGGGLGDGLPRWFAPDVKFVKKFKEVISLSMLREEKKLKDMLVLKRGMRLSVQPVTEKEYDSVLKLAQ